MAAVNFNTAQISAHVGIRPTASASARTVCGWNSFLFYLSGVYCLLFTANQFVNKYVLSVLKFTYPTIFQGWQTLVGAIFIKILSSSGKLPPLLRDTTRFDIAKWLPGMALFVLSIYSGSVALANLPVPVFLSLHSMLILIKYFSDLVINRKLLDLMNYLLLMLLLTSSIAVITTDPEFNQVGYAWMAVFLISSGCYDIYSKLMKGRLKSSMTDILFSNYIYSVVVLAPSSYFLGDALEASKFPYLYFSKFYVGCLCSGILGVSLALTTIKIQKQEHDNTLDIGRIQSFAKIVSAVLSLLVFDIELTGNHVLWITVTLVVSLAFEEHGIDGDLVIGNISIKKGPHSPKPISANSNPV